MIRTVLEMAVREGCERDFERAWLAAAAVTSRYPGAGPQTMLRDPGQPRNYTITADWETREHLAAYQQSPDRKELSAVLEGLRESATRTLREIVAHVPAHDPAHVPAQVPAPAHVPAPVPSPAEEGTARV